MPSRSPAKPCALATHSRAVFPVAMPRYRTSSAAHFSVRTSALEAAAALEGVLVLNLAPEAEILTLLALLDRLCAMLTRLAHMGDRPSNSAQIGQRERSR